MTDPIADTEKTVTNNQSNAVSTTGQYAILLCAFLGWGFAGVHMSINSIVMRVATADMLSEDFRSQGIGTTLENEKEVDSTLINEFDLDNNGNLDGSERSKAREAVLGGWFGWLICAFLFGAAAGGFLFGFVGDRYGRAKAMAGSILCYSIFSGMSYFVESPFQLLVLRFLTCLGIGGMWPNGIALLGEAWPNVSRPLLSGIMGTAANVGILLFALLTINARVVTGEDWRWTFVLGFFPIILGLLSLFTVPESPRWLLLHREKGTTDQGPQPTSIGEIFKPPLLHLTVIGILLGAIPLFGGWGVSNWATAWASEFGDRQQQISDSTKSDDQQTVGKPKPSGPDPVLKSMTVVARSLPGSISSLLGGALAVWLGRKLTYGLLCVGALACTQGLFRVENPIESDILFTISMFGSSLEITQFLGWTFGLGFFSGFFFGWLPLCLPEMFPTRVRSTGAGVSFNWGRILTAFGVLASGVALKEMFQGEYARVGLITGWIYAVGIIVILLAPSRKDVELSD